MNNGIKIRVWNGLRLVYFPYIKTFDNDGLAVLFLSGDYGYADDTISTLESHIMQYTRKNDKNNKEIYDGDLVRNSQGRICEVYWFEPSACWDCKVIKSVDGDSSLDFHPQYWHKLEVIGNIYE